MPLTVITANSSHGHVTGKIKERPLRSVTDFAQRRGPKDVPVTGPTGNRTLSMRQDYRTGAIQIAGGIIVAIVG
ncbi:MAG: hypothetical protein QNL58_07060, partial [Octadecabacter sp.]